MAEQRSDLKILFYMLISVIIPVLVVIINHMFWIDNIFLSIFVIGWMGFALLVLQPYSIDEYETIEP
ncbi:MAG: hypothetical protein R6U61_06915 [Thermoplasmata archaeon]